jgi:hypothetical protein
VRADDADSEMEGEGSFDDMEALRKSVRTKLLFRIVAASPPLVGAFFVSDLGDILNYTGVCARSAGGGGGGGGGGLWTWEGLRPPARPVSNACAHSLARARVHARAGLRVRVTAHAHAHIQHPPARLLYGPHAHAFSHPVLVCPPSPSLL